MRLVIDMNLSADWVGALDNVGVAAVHWKSVGPENASDDLIMAWARDNDAVILTRDLDFGSMLAREGELSPSVVQLRIDQVSSRRHNLLVVEALTRYQKHLEAGALITLEEAKTRVRMLDNNFTS